MGWAFEVRAFSAPRLPTLAIDEISAVTAYDTGDKQTGMFEPSIDYLDAVKPVLKSFPGWKKNIGDITEFAALPPQAKEYIEFIEGFVNVPVSIVSIGAGRRQTLKRK